MNRIYLLAAFFLMLSSCKEKIEEKTIYKGDNCYVKSIYKNEKLKEEQQFFKNGKGELVAQGYLREYYDNGTLATQANFFDDKIVGNQIKYDKTGKEKQIVIMLERGIPIFQLLYNDDGSLKIKGIPLHLNASGSPLIKGKEYIFYYGIITTQNLQSRLIRKFTNPSGRVTMHDTITDFTPDSHEYFIEKAIFNDTGNYLLTVDVTLFERNGGDTLVSGQVVDTFKIVE